ncbi:MAG: hypothetical protein QF752_15825 [Planctomycetota bacterium]|jgi:hypothetical protein|nr:hypothetical protein [Planctomycetota bacterium]
MITLASATPPPIWFLAAGGLAAWALLSFLGCHFKRYLLVLRILETSRIKARHRFEEIRTYLRKRQEFQQGMGIDTDRAARIMETMAQGGGPAIPFSQDLDSTPPSDEIASGEAA